MATKLPTVLVIEDDSTIRRFLRVGLKNHGYVYQEAVSGKEGISQVMHTNPDMIILDLGLPDMDGLEFLKELRGWSKTPVIVLTARDNEKEKIKVLDQGADDYLTKPFGIGELLARIRLAFRHVKGQENGSEPVLQNGSLQIDPAKRQVLVQGQEIHLTPTEYKILLFLAKYADRVVTQHQLLQEIWGPIYTDDHIKNLRFHMHQLRHKLEENPAQPKWLINEPGVGYRFKLE